VIPLATVLTSAFNFGLNLVVVLIFLIGFGIDPQWTWLLFPVAVAALFVLTATVAMALSVLYVRFRDIAIIWTVFAQVLFYATPILYPITVFGTPPTTKEHLLMLNPLAVIFEQVRVWILAEPGAPSAAQAAGGWVHLLPAAFFYCATCAFGVWIFRREAPRIAEDL
jgi:ABC-2 type transport system permease protein